jgi:AcrR family transcriptional regulator
MARKPARATAKRRSPDAASETSASDMSERQRIIQAFLALLAERPMEEIGFADIAARAGLSLADLRGEFSSTLAIIAAHVKEIDRQVLAGGDADMAEEPARERLFDVLMRRLEAMAPHREAIASLMRSARRNPPLAFALNGLAVRSQQWMLTAAEISASGPRGMLRAQGLALLFARVLRTFVDDQDDPSLARTMAALDRELARGQRFAGMLDGACRLSRFGRRSRRRDRTERSGDEPIAA